MRPLRNLFLCLLSMVMLLVLAACGGSSPALSDDGSDQGDKGIEVKGGQEPEVSREEILTSLTDLVIVPRYGQATGAMERFVISAADLCATSGDATLEAARSD